LLTTTLIAKDKMHFFLLSFELISLGFCFVVFAFPIKKVSFKAQTKKD
jgi:hypothetical protein